MEPWKSHSHSRYVPNAAQKQTAENTGCVFSEGKNDVSHPWGDLMTNAKENCTGSCSADTKGLQVLPFTSLALHCVTWEKGTVFLSKMGLKRDVWHQPQGCSKPGLRWSHVKYGLGTLEIMGTILFASIDNISWSTNYFLLISLRGIR